MKRKMASSDDYDEEAVAHRLNNVSLDESGGVETEEMEQETDTDLSDLPTALIVANLDERIFDNKDEKEKFEAIFKNFEESASFQYLKSFRRVRVNYSSPLIAATARITLEQLQVEICDKELKVYFAQPPPKEDSSVQHLQPPLPDKMFLISPPASPPVGWESCYEAEPVVNYDLLAAIANLAPGQTHELHAGSAEQPAIVVHVCEDPEGYGTIGRGGARMKIVQTRCPDRKT
ncbi:calcipressin-1-like [Lingula anatina]|uniref:Calcipressin-1 n=1 Tax=Lingula anatina TaxID=7574 RepID=A0A1S3I5L8_LINAN|nr:calcipressin-1 [Lingula anatina]XP_013393513.1 calcipressin-1-like [Lingula anatina]|eukprot:XP_013393406.1 calcipressin-1 [Lingula anatina]